MTITVYQSGRILDFANVKPHAFVISDIIRGLQMMNRYSGQFYVDNDPSKTITVLAHSLAVARATYAGEKEKGVPEEQARARARWALLHDVHEAYIGDLPGPAMKFFPGVAEVSKSLDVAISERFGVEICDVSEYDRAVLMLEVEHFIPKWAHELFPKYPVTMTVARDFEKVSLPWYQDKHIAMMTMKGELLDLSVTTRFHRFEEKLAETGRLPFDESD